MNQNELYHFGILGQKWGIRRYQNEDGTLTEEGRRHYSKSNDQYGRPDDARYYRDRLNLTSEVINKKTADLRKSNVGDENEIIQLHKTLEAIQDDAMEKGYDISASAMYNNKTLSQYRASTAIVDALKSVSVGSATTALATIILKNPTVALTMGVAAGGALIPTNEQIRSKWAKGTPTGFHYTVTNKK